MTLASIVILQSQRYAEVQVLLQHCSPAEIKQKCDMMNYEENEGICLLAITRGASRWNQELFDAVHTSKQVSRTHGTGKGWASLLRGWALTWPLCGFCNTLLETTLLRKQVVECLCILSSMAVAVS